MNTFIFIDYGFDKEKNEAFFCYGFEDGRNFEERISFSRKDTYNKEALERALYLSFILVGTSYYKCFPSPRVSIKKDGLDSWQTDFFNTVYQEGMSQFAFENNLTRYQLAEFETKVTKVTLPPEYDGEGILSLQSGGKDSLLTASLLEKNGYEFTPWYITSSDSHPTVLDDFKEPLLISKRSLDRSGLEQAIKDGATNGHVPVTYIVMSYALIQAILLGKKEVLVSIGHEGEEPHEWIQDLPVNHQWSKTWQAEQLFAEYVARYVSTNISIGSPIRGYSELRVSELFVQHAWGKYGQTFSSCNLANYLQGAKNYELSWCGNCPKCANAFLLLSPFVPARELKVLFGGQDLFAVPPLQHTFKGLLGVEGVMKPFECIGEIEELRLAYQKAQQKNEYQTLSFPVPSSKYDYKFEYPRQEKLIKFIKNVITNT